MPDDPYLTKRFLTAYFPPSIAERFRDSMDAHRLRRELIATRMVNELVDLVGSTFVFGLMRDHGVGAWQAVRAWLIGVDVLGIGELAESFHAGVPFPHNGEIELEGFFALERATTRAAGWAIQNVDRELPIGAAVESFRGAFQDLAVQFDHFLTAGERERFETAYRELRRAVADGEVAHRLARLAFADHLLSTLALSFARKISPAQAAATYFGLSAKLDFSRLESAIAEVSDEDRWERRAAQELAGELHAARMALCNALLDEGDDFPGAIKLLRSKRSARFAEAAQLLGEVSTMPTVTMPAVHVAIRAISRLAART